MASRFQSRLVGTILVVAVGVILLPDFLDGQKKSYHDEFEVIPLKPDPAQMAEIKQPQEMTEFAGIEAASLDEEEALASQDSQQTVATEANQSEQAQVKVEPTKEATPEPKSEPTQPVAQAKPAPEVSKPEVSKEAVKPQFKDNAWTIQLVALRNKENADKLAADLKKRGYLVNVNVQGGVSRVIIGPELSRDKMLKQIGELEKITGLKGQLRQFKTFQ